MYVMVCSHPNLSYAMSLVSRYMTNPGKDIGMLLSGFLGTYGVHLMLICSLAELKKDLLAMLIQILLLI
jgi:hypothetical protein